MSPATEVRDGLSRVFPVLAAVIPFGLVYGAVAHEAGLTTAEIMGFSALVYAGASQFVALEMIGLGSPVMAVAVAIFALNFRHVLYSASVGRNLRRFSPLQKAMAFFFLVDPVFGEAELRAAQGRITKRFYFAYALVLYASWLLSSLAGAVFGSLLGDPATLALDFILPVYFLTLMMDFRRRTNFLPVALASGLASLVLLMTLGPPWNVTLGALGGILYAVLARPAKANGATAEPDGGGVDR
ncbi:branched-chain amino acid ABC transporter permease [Aureimonas sp. SA4125]|uniref:AzlC family ABC transporter permease n=1 Tax=Aureimonas sp. SA4125 TaxID=2826993 RepID=UPI001CC4984E|nr:AzlC family ABC transporter permease [Aureimonas sp. SA4125]BDA85573.1 branched-chain amino acid ABC transporter permease [Aureimonas sp. SA4125]